MRQDYQQGINYLWPCHAVWWQRTGSTLAQVMALCLMALSHYLNQWWLIISKILLHSSENRLWWVYLMIKQMICIFYTLMAHIYQWTGLSLIVTYSVPSHYPYQWWYVFSLTPRNKLQGFFPTFSFRDKHLKIASEKFCQYFSAPIVWKIFFKLLATGYYHEPNRRQNGRH